MPAHPRRGDIWELQTDGQLEERLVVSSDTWNVLNVGEVLTLEVIAGHYDESGAYAIRVEAEGPKTIYADAILPAPRLGPRVGIAFGGGVRCEAGFGFGVGLGLLGAS